MTSEEFVQHERDVREAMVAFPGMEMGEAYHKFMVEIKKQEPLPSFRTHDPTLEAIKLAIKGTFRRPCDQSGCSGTQVLQGVCNGCAAGRKGYKSMWECEECLYREYSKRPYLDWYNELKEK